MLKKSLLSACIAASVLLTACHDDDDQHSNTSPTPTTTYSNLAGTAAVGAAIKNASVTASCKDGTGFKNEVKTNEQGEWSGQVDSTKLPCALEVKASDTQTLHGYAAKAGNVNITPFTDLALALASSQTPSDWFKTYQPILETTLKTAVDNLTKQLKADGYVLPENFDLLITKFAIDDAFDKALDAFAASLAANQATIKDYAALIEKVKAGDVAAVPDFVPVTPAPVTETCASKKLPVGKLSDLMSYSGDYSDKGTVVLNLNAATGKVIAKGTTATIAEVCGANVQNNGTNYYVITDKGYVTLFKDNAGKYSAESADFTGFYGEKATASPQLCESNGADDKLGFKNAPNDFCSFSKASSVAITSPDIYTFFNADKKENVKITVENSVVKSVAVENNSYAWACGVGTNPACNGVTVKDGQINSKPAKSFYFNNTVLKAVSGTTQDLTVKNNSLLMYLDNSQQTTPTPATSCAKSTNQWGCITITGLASPLIFEHNSTVWATPRVGQFNASNQTVNVQFAHKANPPLEDGITITKANASATYISFALGSITWYQCGTYASETSVCPGLSLDTANRTLTFKDVKLSQQADPTKILTANGILKF